MRACYLLTLLLCFIPHAFAQESVHESVHESVEGSLNSSLGFHTKALSADYKYLDADDNGYLINRGTDSYLVLSGYDLPRDRACYLVLDAEFKEPMFRPGLFEVFWAINPGAFSEKQKARFLLSHEDSKGRNQFVVPLCKLYGFSGNLDKPHYQKNIVGLRLDFPMNRTIGLKIHRLDLVSQEELTSLTQANQMVELEPFERLSGKPFTSLAVAIPKVFFGLEDGWKRLIQDWPFLLVWLAMMLGLLILMIKGKRH